MISQATTVAPSLAFAQSLLVIGNTANMTGLNEKFENESARCLNSNACLLRMAAAEQLIKAHILACVPAMVATTSLLYTLMLKWPGMVMTCRHCRWHACNRRADLPGILGVRTIDALHIGSE